MPGIALQYFRREPFRGVPKIQSPLAEYVHKKAVTHHRVAALFACLQPLRGIIALDCFALYDHGGVTAFDAARGRGDGAGDVAGGQEHRETYRQGGQKGQQDLFDVLLHCAENLVVFVLYGSYGYYGYFCSSASV